MGITASNSRGKEHKVSFIVKNIAILLRVVPLHMARIHASNTRIPILFLLRTSQSLVTDQTICLVPRMKAKIQVCLHSLSQTTSK